MMKNNIIQILKIMVFGIAFWFLFLLITYIKKPLNVDLINMAGFYGEKKNSLDMVYIGGSACFVYWEPLKAWEDEGITSYNFAADTVQAESYQYLIKEALKTQEPKVLVIDARAFQYRDGDQPPNEVAYRNVLTGTPFSWNRYRFIEDNVPKTLNESTLSYHFDLIKYHGTTENNPISISFKLLTGNYRNELKGFYFIPKVKKLEKLNFATKNETPVLDETNKILDDLLKYLKTTNQKVLFVVSPYMETVNHKENFNYIESKVTKAGFDFLDTNEYYDKMKLDFNIDFYNFNHVNIYGSEKYTTFLANYLKENYNLLDKSTDSNYKDDWNSLLDNWHTMVDETKAAINDLIESEE